MELNYSDLEFDEEKYYLGPLCNHEHDWRGTGRSLRYMKWTSCRDCGNVHRGKINTRKKPIWITRRRELNKLADRIAIERNGEKLTDYVDSITKIKWRCKVCGYIWTSTFTQVQLGHWCTPCSYRQRATEKRLPISVYKERTKESGSSFVSLIYERRGKNKQKTAIVSRICSCGRFITSHASTLLYNRKKGCYYCGRELMKGENHPLWNPHVPYPKGMRRRIAYCNYYNFLTRKWKEVMFCIKYLDTTDGVILKAREIADRWTKLSLELKYYREGCQWKEYIMGVRQLLEKHEEHVVKLLDDTNIKPQFLLKSTDKAVNTQLGILREEKSRVIVNAFNHPSEVPTLLEF